MNTEQHRAAVLEGRARAAEQGRKPGRPQKLQPPAVSLEPPTAVLEPPVDSPQNANLGPTTTAPQPPKAEPQDVNRDTVDQIWAPGSQDLSVGTPWFRAKACALSGQAAS